MSCLASISHRITSHIGLAPCSISQQQAANMSADITAPAASCSTQSQPHQYAANTTAPACRHTPSAFPIKGKIAKRRAKSKLGSLYKQQQSDLNISSAFTAPNNLYNLQIAQLPSRPSNNLPSLPTADRPSPNFSMAQQMIEELKRKLAAAEKAQASQKAAETSKAEKPESSKPAKAKSSNKVGKGESRTVAALLDQTQVAVDVSLHSKPASAPAIRAPSPDRPKLQSKIVVPRKNLPSPPILYKEDTVVLEAGESNPPSPKRSRKISEDHRPSHRTTLPSTSKAPQHSASEEPYLLSAGRMKRLMSMIANLREELDDLECQLARCRQLQ